jgi:peptide/nickel transport system substrate-binding protein
MTTTAALTVAANWHTLEGLYEIEPTDPTKAYAALAADEKPRKIDEKTYEVKLREKAAFSRVCQLAATVKAAVVVIGSYPLVPSS